METVILLSVVALLSTLILIGAALGMRAAWGEVPIIPKGQRFTCTPVAVWDGDGPIWCKEGPRLRLARINARELDNSCRPHAPCVATSGVAARDALVRVLGGAKGRTRDGHILVSSSPLLCVSDGSGRGLRTAAWCTSRGRDLSAALVHIGAVAAWTFER